DTEVEVKIWRGKADYCYFQHSGTPTLQLSGGTPNAYETIGAWDVKIGELHQFECSGGATPIVPVYHYWGHDQKLCFHEPRCPDVSLVPKSTVTDLSRKAQSLIWALEDCHREMNENLPKNVTDLIRGTTDSISKLAERVHRKSSELTHGSTGPET
ncbi:MAG TPA: hypothetical protein VKP30_09895, partial [Polyangiaceae bacterium]|nr:hypothetical protein [Polyangiaceae bacterium]